MTEPRKMVSFMEDVEIIEQIDAAAAREGTDRSAFLRRAVRKELFYLSTIPTFRKNPADKETVIQEQP